MGVDFWSQDAWERQIAANSVLVMTYQIMLNCLSCAFLTVRSSKSEHVHMGVDFWSRDAWERQVAATSVLVMTYQIMLSCPSCAFLTVRSFKSESMSTWARTSGAETPGSARS